MKKEQYIVTVMRPDKVSVNEMKSYIRDAVNGWSGQFHPDDPLFHLPPVKVSRDTWSPKMDSTII